MTKDLIIEIKADTKEALKEIEELKKEIKEFSENIKKGNVSLKTQDEYLNKVAKRITQMAHAYAGFEAVKSAVSVMADFEESIRKLGAISGVSKKELEALEQKAKELGKSTQFGASEVADGMNYLAMAGYKTKDILASIGDILNLAQVGMIDLARAADIASNILSGFGMGAEETKRVVDVMTATITNANTNIPELGEAMKYVAPQAKALGVSLEETASAIGILSNAGIKATMAGTGLSTMLVRLASPTGAAADAIKELGIQIYDANGKFVGLANILRQFKEKMASMSQEMKAKYIRDIFGLETMKTAITLIDSIGSDYDELYKKIANSMDISEKKAKQMSDTFKGHLKELESAIEGLIIAIGDELLPALIDFVKLLTDGVQGVGEFYEKNKELINALVKLTAIFIGLGKIRSIIEGVLGAKASADVVVLVKNIKNLKVAFLALGSAILKLTRANAILLALSVAIEGISYAMGEWEEKINRVNEATQALQESTKSFNEFLSEIKKHMDGSEIKASVEELEKLKNITEELIKADEKRIEKLKELLQTQKDKSLKRELDELIKRHNQLLAWYEKLKNAKPYEEASKSAKDAQSSVEKLTKEQEKYLIELDKRLKKEQNTTKTILQLRDEEIAKAREVFGKSRYFEEARAKIVEFYNKKELQQFKDTYTKRVKVHSETIEKLKAKEKELTQKIQTLQKELLQQLKAIENQRLLEVERIENKIHSLKMSGASEYEKYIDTKKQADIAYNKAKEALVKKEFELAKHYMREYESLISSLANKEIKENDKVKLSKKEANKIAIEGLKKLESLTNEYYAKEKEAAKEAFNQKMQQLKAQLSALKAQLNLEVKRLNLEKQMIELLTGKKVDIDTTEALKAIKNLDNEIKALDEKIKSKKEIDADTKKAEEKIDKTIKKIDSQQGEIEVTADTSDAFDAILEIEDKISGKKEVIKLYADNEEPKKKIKEFDFEVKSLKPLVKVNSDITDALRKLRQIPRVITTIHYVKTIETHASGGIAGFRRVSGKIPGDDPLNSDDVPALLTRGEFVIRRDAVKHYGEEFLYKLNAKMLPKFATGGLVEIGSPTSYDTLSSFSSSFNFDLEHVKIEFDVDLSIVEELRKSIEKLGKFLKEAFPMPSGALEDNGSFGVFAKEYNELKNEVEQKSNDFKEEVQEDKKEVKKEEEEINSEIDKANKLSFEIEKIKESLKGSVLQENEYKTISSKLNSMQEQFNFLLKDIEIKKEKLDSFVESAYKKIEQKEKDLYSYEDKIYEFEDKVSDYLEKVSDTKDEIKEKISELGAEDKLTDRFEKSTNLKELTSYLKTLEELPSVEEIKNKIKQNLKQEMDKLRPQLEWAARRYYTSPYLAPDFLKLKAKYEELDRLYHNNTLLEKKAKEELLAKIPKFQTGGLIALQNGGKLPGYGGGDRNLALLEDGEFVIRKEAVRHFGVDLFSALNSLKLPKFQIGGLVGDIASANTSKDVMNINFKFPDGKSFEMQSDEVTAKALESYLKRMM